jgi:hypothetical protein
MPGAFTAIEEAGVLAEEAAPTCGRLLADASRVMPQVAKLVGRAKIMIAPASRAGAEAMHEVVTKATRDFESAGDALRREWQSVSGAKAAGAGVNRSLSTREIGSLNRSPRPSTPEEEEAHMERLLRMMDDFRVGMPPTELTNQGLGARLWQFGTAGGDVVRERANSATSGNWASELLTSRAWLQQNAGDLQHLPGLTQRFPGGSAQMVEQGISTQFAASPLSVGLRTDNVATCAAVYCTDGTTQFLGHADGMIHHEAVSEALNTAGIDLNKSKTTLMPGPHPSPVLETILPAFMKNSNAMRSLRIVPFKGPANGSVIARDGKLYLP